AVGAPMPFVFAGIGIEDDHASVAVAVSDIGFVGRRVHNDLSRLAEIGRVIASLALTDVANLEEKSSVLGELQDFGILLAVASDQNIALVVDGEAVVRLGPLKALTRTSPVPNKVTRLIELENGRGWYAAGCNGRVEGCALFIPRKRPCPVHYPDVILGVYGHADTHPEYPV